MKPTVLVLLLVSLSSALDAPQVDIQAECDGYSTTVQLSWPVIEGATGYRVLHSDHQFGPWVLYEDWVQPPFMAIIPTGWDWQSHPDRLGFFSVVARDDVRYNPIAHYLLQSDAMNSAQDAFHGIVYGSEFGEDRFGIDESACYFDGIDDYILLTEPITPEKISITTWFKVGLPFGLSNMSMIRHRHHAYNLAIVNVNNSARLFCDVWLDQSTRYMFTSSGMGEDDGNWHHVAMTYDKSQFCVYFDGSPIYTSNIHGHDRDIYYGIGATAFGRGGDIDDFYFYGALDDIRYYDQAIDLDEVIRLYE